MEDGGNRSDKDLIAEEAAPSSTNIERAIGIEDEIADADEANITGDKTPKTLFVDFYFSIVIAKYKNLMDFKSISEYTMVMLSI